jgi:hypothetical protein
MAWRDDFLEAFRSHVPQLPNGTFAGRELGFPTPAPDAQHVVSVLVTDPGPGPAQAVCVGARSFRFDATADDPSRAAICVAVSALENHLASVRTHDGQVLSGHVVLPTETGFSILVGGNAGSVHMGFDDVDTIRGA